MSVCEDTDTNKMSESIAEKTAKLQRLLGDTEKDRYSWRCGERQVFLEIRRKTGILGDKEKDRYPKREVKSG